MVVSVFVTVITISLILDYQNVSKKIAIILAEIAVQNKIAFLVLIKILLFEN